MGMPTCLCPMLEGKKNMDLTQQKEGVLIFQSLHCQQCWCILLRETFTNWQNIQTTQARMARSLPLGVPTPNKFQQTCWTSSHKRSNPRCDDKLPVVGAKEGIWIIQQKLPRSIHGLRLFVDVCGASGSLCLCQRTSLEVMHSSELDDKYDPEHLATGKQGSHVPCFVYTTLAHFMHVRWLRKNAECS